HRPSRTAGAAGGDSRRLRCGARLWRESPSRRRMAGTVSTPGSLRLKLLTAFALVSAPPLLCLALAVLFLVGRAFDTVVNRRLDATRRRLEARERRADAEVEAIGDDLPLPTNDERTAQELAERHRLQALEILEPDGRVLSSAHWPAGFGLVDEDGVFDGAPAYR